MNKKPLIPACLLLVCTGCYTVLNTLEVPPLYFTGVEHRSIPHTNKVVDVPRYDETRGDFVGKPFVYYTWAKQREEQLGLESPEVSKTNRLLRIWGSFSYHPRQQRGFLAEFVYDGSSWSGRFYDYTIQYNPWGNSEEIVKKRSFDLVPQHGWESFGNTLHETRLIDLSTDEKIPGLKYFVCVNKIDTAATYSVEYSTPNAYRFFIYQKPQKTQAHFDAAARFMRFHDCMFDIVNECDPLRSTDRLKNSAEKK